MLSFRVRNPPGAAHWEPGEALLWESGQGKEPRRVPLFLEGSRLGPGEEGVLGVNLEGVVASSVWRLEMREKGGSRHLRLGTESAHGQ